MDQMLLCHCVSAYHIFEVAHESLFWPFLLGVSLLAITHAVSLNKGGSATQGFVFLETATE